MHSFSKGVVVVFALIGVIATIQQLRGQGTAPLQGATFTHIGIVTKDITRTAQMFADVYGITPPAMVRIYDNNGKGIPFPPGIKGNTVFGASSNTGMTTQKWNFATGGLDATGGAVIRPADVHATLLDSMGLSYSHLSNQAPRLISAIKR